MAAKTRAEAIKEAVSRLIERENSSGPCRYAETAYFAFEEIRRLRDLRISFAEICGAFESSGLLPENADPHTFGDAYRRERARRAKMKGGSRAETEKLPGRAYKSGMAAAKIQEPAKPEPPAAPGGKDRVKELTGALVDTGNGVIVKLPNGSFEF
jgi:hypothetical protein